MTGKFALSFFVTAVWPLLSFASNSACMIEGKLGIGASIAETKDCMQFVGASTDADKIKKSCEGIRDLESAVKDTPAKITYLAQCPKGQLGICSGIFHEEIDAYHYKRSRTLLETSKENCAELGGKWK